MQETRVDPRLLRALKIAFAGFVRELSERHPNWRDLQSLPTLLSYDELAYESLVRKWRCRREFKEVSTVALCRRLENAVVSALDAPAKVDVITEQLAIRLETPMSCEIILPLSGIDLRHVSLMLADDIIATFIAADRYDELIVEPYERGTVARGEPKDLGRRLAEFLRPAIADRSVLRITAVGDEDSALWAAQKRADLAVDALQFIAAISEEEQWHYYVDWRGTSPAMGWQSTAVIPREGYVLSMNPAKRTGPMRPWPPRSDALAHLQKHGGFELAILPLKEAPTIHESRLARAVRAVAEGERGATTDNRKMSYVAVFDIFFSVPESDDVTRNIREGVAFALYGLEPQRDDARLELATFINRVYQSRGDTTHEFQIGLFEPADLARLRGLAINFIGLMSERFCFVEERKRDIVEWLNRCREALGTERYEPYNKLSRVRIDIARPSLNPD